MGFRMFGIFGTRRPQDGGFPKGFTDWHSHIMPGVDDGVATMEEALEILADYDRLGIAEVWLTPHIMEDIPNTTAALRARFDELCNTWSGRVKLHLGAEYMLDNLFEKRLAAGDLLPVGAAGDHLLVETSCFTPPMDLRGILDRVRAAGFHPVLAHPERYMYMGDGDYRELASRGVKFQLNLGSPGGMYGITAKRKARRLLRAGQYAFAGTDLHRKAMLGKMAACNIG